MHTWAKVRRRLLLAKLRATSYLASFSEPAANPPRTIAFLCYYTMVPWNGGSLPSGTAGAEQAVVELARSLAGKGWRVTVFCNCGMKRVLDGVTYTQEYKFNALTKYNTVVIWRDSRLSRFRYNACATYLWMHNVPVDGTLGPADLAGTRGVIVLSEFHARSLLEIAPERIFMTQNGVRIVDGTKYVERKEHRFIYASSPGQGLEILLRLWPTIRAYIPDAELAVFYGWEIWDTFNGASAWARQWKSEINTLLLQPGVVVRCEHISPDDLQLEFAASSVWLYPTEASEVSCINAMLAQALGAIPVTTTVGALKETVRFGRLIDSKNIYTDEIAQLEFVKAAVESLLQHHTHQRSNMMAWAREHFSWDNVASNWQEKYFPKVETSGAARREREVGLPL